MRLFVFLLCIFFQSGALAQVQKNYLNYHKQVLKAEELFFVHQFDSSIRMYQAILKKYPKPFAEDCFIALQFAGLRKDTAAASFFFLKAFETGITWNSLFLSKHIKSMLNDVAYSKRVSILYAAGRSKYLKSINWTLRDSIKRLIHNDDLARRPINQAVINHTLKKDRNGMYQIYGEHPAVLDKNLSVLNRIAADVGWPGQHIIGIYDQDSDKQTNNFFIVSIADLILYHHTCGLYLLDKSLLKAIKDGELLPAEYALFYEWAYDDFYQSKGQFRGGNTIYHFNIKCEYPPQKKFYNNYLNSFFYCHDTMLVNSCRREIGMESLQHAKLKDDFARRNDMILRFGFFEKY